MQPGYPNAIKEQYQSTGSAMTNASGGQNVTGSSNQQQVPLVSSQQNPSQIVSPKKERKTQMVQGFPATAQTGQTGMGAPQLSLNQWPPQMQQTMSQLGTQQNLQTPNYFKNPNMMQTQQNTGVPQSQLQPPGSNISQQAFHQNSKMTAQLGQLNVAIKQVMSKAGAGISSAQLQHLTPANQAELQAVIMQQQMQGQTQLVTPMSITQGNNPQTTQGPLLNHHRRKQYRNLPVASKLEQLPGPYHSAVQAQNYQVGPNGGLVKPNNNLRNSQVVGSSGLGGRNPQQIQQANQDYYISQTQTPQTSAQIVKQQQQVVLQQLKPPQKLRTNMVVSAQQDAIRPPASGDLKPPQAHGNIYKMKSSQNVRLDDEIARERVQSVNPQVERLQQAQGQAPEQRVPTGHERVAPPGQLQPINHNGNTAQMNRTAQQLPPPLNKSLTKGPAQASPHQSSLPPQARQKNFKRSRVIVKDQIPAPQLQQVQQVQQLNQNVVVAMTPQSLPPPVINTQRPAPSRGGPSTYYIDDHLTESKTSLPEGSKIQITVQAPFPSRIIQQKDINFSKDANDKTAGGEGQRPFVSPMKKNAASSSNAGNSQVERIQVTIPSNPLTQPNASVQVQYQQELIRNVLQRVDDIFHLRQLVDLKNYKLKDKAAALNDNDCTAVFDEVKNREIQRVNKENSMLVRYKDARIDDKLLRRQFVKGCKKISIAFKGVVDEDEDLERELVNSKELIISETSCLEIMGEKLSKKQACNMTSKHKLVEASLKEKDYDPYFSICIVLQGARNTFMREVQRHIDCYCDNVESMNAQNAARRTYKNMNDTHHVRRVKLFRDTKIDKYYKLLITFNDESRKHIATYLERFKLDQKRQLNYEAYINQEVTRMNRGESSTRGIERDTSSGGGSRLRSGSKRQQDQTPSKQLSSKDVARQNPSLSSSDSNIVSLKNQGAARNIKTPQSQSKKKEEKDGEKPTRLTLKMLSQSKKDKANLNSSQKAEKDTKKKSDKPDAPVTSRKSLKQLQQMKRRQAAEMSEHQSDTTRTGGFESRMRVASGKGYSEAEQYGNERTPMSNMFPHENLLLVADAFGPKPIWFQHYVKFSKAKRENMLLRHLSHRCFNLMELQKILPQRVLKEFWHVEDDERQVQLLNFILMRSLLRLQYCCKAYYRLRHECAVRLQRAIRSSGERANHRIVVQMRVDQQRFKTMIRKIQRWYRAHSKLIRSRRSKVNPAVEQVLRDPQRVQNSKMIQEILIPIVLRIQRSIRYWIYRRKYLPYLRLKRLRDKIRVTKKHSFVNIYRHYQPIIQGESQRLHKQVGFETHMKMMPAYFDSLNQQAQKQLSNHDLVTVVRARFICENKIETAYDEYRHQRLQEARSDRTKALIQTFYA